MKPRRLPIFVYGTLRDGGANAHVFGPGAVVRSQPAWLDGATMTSVGYPYVWRSPDGIVVGELKHLDDAQYERTLAGLDALEGYHGPGRDNEYEREVAEVRLGDDSRVPAWVYVVEEATGAAHPQIASGDWSRRDSGPTARRDVAEHRIAAPTPAVFAALVDPTAWEAWQPPVGPVGRVQHFEPWPGGRYRAGGATGRFVLVVPDALLVLTVEGHEVLMTMTWRLTADASGTRVALSADDVPPTFSPREHAHALDASLHRLAAYVEA